MMINKPLDPDCFSPVVVPPPVSISEPAGSKRKFRDQFTRTSALSHKTVLPKNDQSDIQQRQPELTPSPHAKALGINDSIDLQFTASSSFCTTSVLRPPRQPALHLDFTNSIFRLFASKSQMVHRVMNTTVLPPAALPFFVSDASVIQDFTSSYVDFAASILQAPRKRAKTVVQP